MSRRASLRAYVLGLAATALVPAVVFGTLAQFNLADQHPMLLAGIVSCALALAFGLKWPHKAWRWGLWVSGGLGLVLVLAFIGLLGAGRVDVQPLLEASALMFSACLAGGVGGRAVLRRDSRTSTASLGE